MSTIPPSKLDSLILDPLDIPSFVRESIQDAAGRVGQQDPAVPGEIPAFLRRELQAAGALSLVLPRSSGGLEASLTTVLHVYEEFGRLDATTAWAVWNENFSWIFSLLDPAGAPHVLGRGSTSRPEAARPSGTARRVEGGYRISGRWKIEGRWGTGNWRAGKEGGAADWLVVTAALTEDAAPRPGRVTAPDVRGFVLHRKQLVRPVPSATRNGEEGGSSDVVLDDAFVPGGLTGAIDRPALPDRPRYQGFLPAFVFAGVAAVALGVAQSGVEAMARTVRTMTAAAEPAAAEVLSIRSALASSEVILRETRAALHAAAKSLDTAAGRRQPATRQQRTSLTAAVGRAAEVSSQVLMLMYDLAISYTPLHDSNPLERLIQDSMPLLQQAHQAAAFLEDAGKVPVGTETA